MSEITTNEDLGLSRERLAELIRAKMEAAGSRSKAKPPLEKQGKSRLPPGYALINLEALKRLAIDTDNVPLLVLVRLEEIWAGPAGRVATRLEPFETSGFAVSAAEKSRGLAALRKAGLIP
jgi:hypothetical protein